MVTLITPRVWEAITAAASSAKTPSFAAVAYFGTNGDKMLPLVGGSKLVINAAVNTVRSGSTDPHSLLRAQKNGVSIFNVTSLHAKIFAFDNTAFVGSSNASRNSRENLIEAVWRTRNKSQIAAVRQAVDALCFNELSKDDLEYLAKIYKPPPTKNPQPLDALFSSLIMELTLEQGKGRETQVQPPRPVWENYFGVDVDSPTLPVLRVTFEGPPTGPEIPRQLIKHHHNVTIEIPEAGSKRPAILVMRKVGKNRYRYRVLIPGNKQFASATSQLKTRSNPLWTSGRRWAVF
jgi:hypothetical protein